MSLRQILVPIDGSIECNSAVRRIEALMCELSLSAALRLLYVGNAAPSLIDKDGVALDWPLTIRHGPIVDTILDAARALKVDLIAMPTAGRHGLMGAIRGSTTARVLDDARWPLLAVPTG